MRAPALPASIGVGLGMGTVALIALGGAAWWLYAQRDKFNPASADNLANQAVSSAVSGASGGAAAGGEDSLGGVLARAREWLSGDDARIREMLKGSSSGAVAYPVSAPAVIEAVPIWGEPVEPTAYDPFREAMP